MTRILFAAISIVITVLLVFMLNTKWVLPVAFGKLLSPQHGIWQNAEPNDVDYGFQIQDPSLKGKVDVYLDDRLVPHVFAEKDQDAFFVQGFIHAKFRLWQMELQTHAAAGRLSELVGSKALQHDREFRRLGMVTAAEAALIELEKDTLTKVAIDAYTSGVNAFLNTLTESQLPLEYKLMDYHPEKWSNLKSALFLKYMSYDLAGYDDDFEMTNAKNFFSKTDFDLLYPNFQDSLSPIVPKDSFYARPSIHPVQPQLADSLYFDNQNSIAFNHSNPDRENGSNNWAVSASKTRNHAPILCNDPHLGLNLPSLWFEMQLSTPSYNAYGVSFPGTPGIIIGYNDACSWGFTNGGRDVKDYYEIKFKDDTKKEYWFDSQWVKTDCKIETFKIRDAAEIKDTVAYTIFGPVMYDAAFNNSHYDFKNNYALRWTAHDAGNELKLFLLLNQAKNYADYLEASKYLRTPGQNIVFASKAGDIAIRAQGNWPAKWNGQGDFIMPGTDSSYMWQGMIPFDEVPFQLNPLRGFVSSANQRPVDSTYPYYLGRGYPMYRGILVNKMLSQMNDITPEDMMKMQTNNENGLAQSILPLMLKHLQIDSSNADQLKFADLLYKWDRVNDRDSKAATVFKIFWDELYDGVYEDEFLKAPAFTKKPFETTLVESLLRDSTYKFVDNTTTDSIESLKSIVSESFKNAVTDLKKIEQEGRLNWSVFKSTGVNHLGKIAAFSRLNLPVGGSTYSINAIEENHGPSWRMVVSLSSETDAYGIYPGGQSGNPGSSYYDNFIDKWVDGSYFKLWLMKKQEANDKRIKWKMSFVPSST